MVKLMITYINKNHLDHLFEPSLEQKILQDNKIECGKTRFGFILDDF